MKFVKVPLDELKAVEAPSGKHYEEEKRKIISKLPIELVLTPFVDLSTSALQKTLRTKVGEVLGDSRLQSWGVNLKRGKKGEVEEEDDDDDDEYEEEEEWTGFD